MFASTYNAIKIDESDNDFAFFSHSKFRGICVWQKRINPNVNTGK